MAEIGIDIFGNEYFQNMVCEQAAENVENTVKSFEGNSGLSDDQYFLCSNGAVSSTDRQTFERVQGTTVYAGTLNEAAQEMVRHKMSMLHSVAGISYTVKF